MKSIRFNSFCIFLTLIIALFMFPGCGKASDNASDRTSASAGADQVSRKMAPRAEEKESDDLSLKDSKMKTSKKRKESTKEGRDSRNKSDGKKVTSVLITRTPQASERLLEYKINLTYETREFQEARQELLKIVESHGFIRSGNSQVSDDRLYLNTTIHVRSKDVYDVLQKLKRLGDLKSSRTDVNDLTDSMVWQSRVSDRERIRVRRKANLSGYKPSSRNWVERNNSLENSENRQDTAAHARWRINDKTSWAKISIHLRGPEKNPGINVPNYMNILYGLTNIFLKLTYILAYLSPFIVFFGLVIWKRKVIFGVFRKNK